MIFFSESATLKSTCAHLKCKKGRQQVTFPEREKLKGVTFVLFSEI